MSISFTTVKKGYDPIEVNRHITLLEEELNGFRGNQAAIANALIHSENAAQKIINDAHSESERIRKESEEQLLELQKKIKHMRMKLDAFQSNYNQLMHKYIIAMNNEDFIDLFDSLDSLSESLTQKTTGQHLRQSNNIVEMKYESAVVDY
jgi:hypothetical protein